MNSLPVLMHLAYLGLVGLVVFFVIAWIPMPDWARRICQVLLVLILALDAVTTVTAGPRPRDLGAGYQGVPRLAAPPSIIAPEPRR